MARSDGLASAMRSFTSRGLTLPITAVSVLVSTGAVVRTSGAEVFGYVSLVGGLFLLLPFADLGLGAALVNAAASSADVKKDLALQDAVRRAFRTLLVVALLGVVLAVALGLSGSWPVLLGVGGSKLAGGVNLSASIALAAFACSIPLGLGQRLLLGLDLNHLSIYVAAISSLVSLGVTLLLIASGLPVILAGAASAIGILVMSFVSFVTALHKMRWSATQVVFRNVAFDSARIPLVAAAVPMVVINSAVAIAGQSDRIVLSLTGTGATTIAIYSTVAQFFNPASSLIGSLAASYWPRFRMREDITRDFRQAMLLLLVAGSLGAVLFLVLTPIVASFVVGGKVPIDFGVVAAFSVLLLVSTVHQPSGMLLTTVSGLRFQAVCCLLMLPTNLLTSVALVPALGASAPVWGSVLAVTSCQVVPTFLRARVVVRKRRSAAAAAAALSLAPSS